MDEKPYYRWMFKFGSYSIGYILKNPPPRGIPKDLGTTRSGPNYWVEIDVVPTYEEARLRVLRLNWDTLVARGWVKGECP